MHVISTHHSCESRTSYTHSVPRLKRLHDRATPTLSSLFIIRPSRPPVTLSIPILVVCIPNSSVALITNEYSRTCRCFEYTVDTLVQKGGSLVVPPSADRLGYLLSLLVSERSVDRVAEGLTVAVSIYLYGVNDPLAMALSRRSALQATNITGIAFPQICRTSSIH